MTEQSELFQKAARGEFSREQLAELLREREVVNIVPVGSSPGYSEPDAFAKFPCSYRTPTLQIHVCKPCHGARLHTICECSFFKTFCTVRASDAKHENKPVLCCLTCEDRKD